MYGIKIKIKSGRVIWYMYLGSYYQYIINTFSDWEMCVI